MEDIKYLQNFDYCFPKAFSLVTIIAVVFLLTSCTIVGYTSGLKSLPETAKMRIVQDSSLKIQDLNNDGNIYIVNESQIKDYISAKDSVLVHIWIASCVSETCISPALFESYCDQKGYAPICILGYMDYPSCFLRFDSKQMPCLFLNVSDYSKDRPSRYIYEFQEHMTGTKEFVSLYYLFKNGQFDRFVQKLE